MSMIQKATQIPRDLQTIKFQINSALESEKKQSRKPSEILPTLLGCHQEFLMGHMGWWRPFGLEAELEMADDPVDGLSFFDKRDDSHLATTCGAT
jgi:hypothetical protein